MNIWNAGQQTMRSLFHSKKVTPIEDMMPEEMSPLVYSNVERQRMYYIPGVIVPETHASRSTPIQTRNQQIFVQPNPLVEGVPLSCWNRGIDATSSSKQTLEANQSILGTSQRRVIDIADIVDVNQLMSQEDIVAGHMCSLLIESKYFRFVVLGAILLNTVLVGLQTNEDVVAHYSWLFQATDNVILTIFTLEIIIKWFNGFWMFWRIPWNVFDFFLVAISIVGNGLEFLRRGGVLRIVSVLRAFRSLRSISALKGLQMVVQTIVRSLPDMVNTLLLLLILMFSMFQCFPNIKFTNLMGASVVFSVIGVDTFGRAAPNYFGSIGSSLYTLFVFMSQDGWADIYLDLKGHGFGISAAIYSVIFIVLAGFIFANVVVGVTVTQLQAAYKETEMIKRVIHRDLLEDKLKTLGEDDESKNVVGVSNDEDGDSSCVGIDGVKSDVWKSQKHHYTPTFRNTTISAFENYCLVLTAIESNIAQRQQLTEALEKILVKVKELNRTDGVKDSEESSEEEGDDFYADALTKMMAMEKEHEKGFVDRKNAILQRLSVIENMPTDNDQVFDEANRGKKRFGSQPNNRKSAEDILFDDST